VVGLDSIKTGPMLVGLQVKTKTKSTTTNRAAGRRNGGREEVVVVEETEDQKALRLVSAESPREGNDEGAGGVQPVIESLPILQPGPIMVVEGDVEWLSDPALLEDYARVPVAQFGAAFLDWDGMGWERG